MAYAKAAQSLATAKSLKVAAAVAASNNSTTSNTSSSTSSSSSGHQSHSSLQNGVSSIGSGSDGSSSSVISAPQYSVDETTALVELLTGLGCPESAPLTASGTLPRRRDTLGTPYEKTVTGII